MPPTLSISNRLLRSLAADDLDPLRPHLHAVTLSHRQALSKPGTPIEDVYFVQDGMVSLVQPLENGAMIEVGMIGNEGFVGVPVLLGAETSPLETMVQIPGSALRMQASAFRDELSRLLVSLFSSSLAQTSSWHPTSVSFSASLVVGEEAALWKYRAAFLRRVGNSGDGHRATSLACGPPRLRPRRMPHQPWRAA
jgi:CRP-like cAMP-binding protein